MARPSGKAVLLPLLLLGLVILVFLLTMLTQPGMEAEPFANRSIYNSDGTGYRAWYLASRKAGLPMSIWQKPFRNINELPTPSTMLLVEPYTVARTSITFGPQDTRALLSWVEEGNTLILLDDFQRRGSESLLTRLGLNIRIQASDAPPKHLKTGNLPGIIRSYVSQPLLSEDKHWLLLGRNSKDARIVLQDDSGHPVMVRLPHGQGAIILGTPVDLGSNKYLHGKPNDNLQFLSNLLVVERKPLFINEFVHGYSEIDNIFAYFQQKTPLGRIFAQIIFGFLFVLWLSFVSWLPRRKSGGTEPLPADTAAAPSGSMTAFINSLAGIYHRTRSSNMALDPQLARIEATLRKRYRVSLDEEAKVQHLLAGLPGGYSRGTRRDGDGNESGTALWESLKKARETVRRKERLQNRELLQLSRQLSTIQERLEHGSHGQGARTRQRR